MIRSFLNHATVSKLVEPLNRDLTRAVHALADNVDQDALLRDGSGYGIIVTPTQMHVKLEPVTMPPGTSSISIWCVSREWDDSAMSEADTLYRVDLPTKLLMRDLGRFHVYRLRLHVPEYEQTCTDLGTPDNPLYRGYIGITKRHFFTRFKEHRASAQTGGTTTLYRSWGYLDREKIAHYPALQLIGTADSLDEAYAIEEAQVAAKTLRPLGLNTIPGGMAGIRMMHELRVLGGDKNISIVDRDRALEKIECGDKSSPCAHFRSGHFRRLFTGQLTWVRPCWVNPKLDIAA